MKKYRKRPVVIEAIQWQPGMTLPAVFSEAQYAIGEGGKVLSINTLEGTMSAQPGDWIIRGLAGEFYPCKPEIFEKSYEAVTCSVDEEHVFKYKKVSTPEYHGSEYVCEKCGMVQT